MTSMGDQWIFRVTKDETQRYFVLNDYICFMFLSVYRYMCSCVFAMIYFIITLYHPACSGSTNIIQDGHDIHDSAKEWHASTKTSCLPLEISKKVGLPLVLAFSKVFQPQVNPTSHQVDVASPAHRSNCPQKTQPSKVGTCWKSRWETMWICIQNCRIHASQLCSNVSMLKSGGC